jgi:hypothetical protein
MKILIGFLLALFISSHAYAQTANEIINKGKIISSHNYQKLIMYGVIYKKHLYKCNMSNGYLTCYKPRDGEVIIAP